MRFAGTSVRGPATPTVTLDSVDQSTLRGSQILMCGANTYCVQSVHHVVVDLVVEQNPARSPRTSRLQVKAPRGREEAQRHEGGHDGHWKERGLACVRACVLAHQAVRKPPRCRPPLVRGVGGSGGGRCSAEPTSVGWGGASAEREGREGTRATSRVPCLYATSTVRVVLA